MFMYNLGCLGNESEFPTTGCSKNIEDKLEWIIEDTKTSNFY